jgi:predicted lipoprotein with Yx(FWY)xxD motif
MGMGKIDPLLVVVVALAIGLAGCGDSNDGPEPGAYGLQSEQDKTVSEETESDEKPKKVFRASIWRADSEDLERGLFEFDGFTLYRFTADKGSTPTCYGACAKQWPPLLTEGKPNGVDVIRSKIGTTKRKDGTIQVTYFGYPLYTFSGDRVEGGATGLVNGNAVEAFGGTWYALKANGQDAPS